MYKQDKKKKLVEKEKEKHECNDRDRNALIICEEEGNRIMPIKERNQISVAE